MVTQSFESSRHERVGACVRSGAALAAASLLLVAAGCGSSGGGGSSIAGAELPWVTATRGPEAAVLDELGREVSLRGVNFNHLGDYFEAHPSLPRLSPLTEEDWSDAAALGMNTIRLVTNWSAWEPQRDQIDLDYVQRVRAAIDEANAHDMYVVIDMHQDAWSKFIFTPVDEICPEGTSHQHGWDGAPDWATFTDDAPTCTPGRREESPAVQRAWANFYENREGVRQELAELWGFIAREFADHAGVAGFDLLNEPGVSADGDASRAGLAVFYREAIAEIRAAEAEVGARGHVIFFEPTVFGGLVRFDLSDDPHLVWAGHNYVESIGPSFSGLLELSFVAYDLVAKAYGTTLWVGEYGDFGSVESREAWYQRFAAGEDRVSWAGGTWWQWEQECGDPHEIQWPPTEEWLARKQIECGVDRRMHPASCAHRAYARATPGRLDAVTSVPCGEVLDIRGRTDAPGEADLWFPEADPDEVTAPKVEGEGIGRVDARRVRGGWRLKVQAEGDYAISVRR